ncbi:hypothetical protein Hsw_1603 [Hymenobacter swuensis DY53]|uniref:Uncharacterized protein n=1 Tax=Hymenobacter swuensis DY53 TaxID=1227739 RepID=W8EX92_9BACT|nr:hypothetical protein Hsw_1603 [Hymenobacter swuensis DY53]
MGTELLTSPSGFDFVQCIPDQAIIIARLHIRASEVSALIRQLDPQELTKASPLYIFVDTFVPDVQLYDAPLTNIVARVIDVGTPMKPLIMPAKSSIGEATLLILTQEIRGSGDQPSIKASPSGGTYALPMSFNTVKTPQLISSVVDGKEFTVTVTTEPMRIKAIARKPHVWNMLKAQFARAAELLEVPAQRAEGVSILKWVVGCTHTLGTAGGALGPEATQLNYQATALVLLASGDGAARSVPVWSEAYLQTRITDLLSVLQGYENKIQSLEIRSDVQQTVESLAAALRDVAGADEQALATAARLNQEEIDAAWKQYGELSWAYELQEHTVRLAFLQFKAGLDMASTMRTLTTVLEIVGVAVQLGAAYFGAGVPDPNAAAASAAKAESKAVDLARSSASAIEKMALDIVKKNLVEQVMKLKTALEHSAKIGKAAAEAGKKALDISKAQTLEERNTIALPDLAEIGAIDPELDWNIFITRTELTLHDSMHGGSGKDGAAPVAGAKEYYMSLYTLTEYGKALSLKSVALARLQARSLEIAAQRNAARFAMARWDKLQREAKTLEEKISLCKSLLLEAAINTKRSLLVIAEGYRAAYAYNYLVEPPMKLRLSMDYNALNEEFKSIKRDIEQLFAKPRLDQEVETGFFEIPVVRASSLVPDTGNYAQLSVLPGQKPRLSWSTPLNAPPFDTWLSEGQRSAYFITEAWFYLKGAQPSSKGVISLRVATTGRYENGYGGSPSAHFISQGMGLNFGYEANEKPFTRWRPIGVSKDNYMMPSPFTNWLATIEQAGDLSGLTAIRMKLLLTRRDLD